MNKLSSTRIAALSSLPLVLTLLACGGRVNPEAGADDTGTSEDSSAKVDSGPLPSDAPIFEDVPTPGDAPFPTDGPAVEDAPLPSSSVCDTLVKAICGPAKSCCESKKVPFDFAGCESAERSYCEQQRTWTKTGRLTYDPSQLDNCVSGWSKALGVCSVDWIDWFHYDLACAHLFNGTIAVGDKCTYDIECNSPTGARGYCDTSSKRCRVYDFVGVGAGCNFSGKTVHYCEKGLFCDTTSTTPTCKKELPLGSTCDGPDDFSCGYHNVCKDNKCVVGLPAGAACDSTAFECSSWTCTSGKCTSNDVELADPSICTGTDTGGGATP
jgi:hypothetical protein